MEGTAQIRTAAGAWSLAGDRQLLQLINSLHQKITSKCEETNSKMRQMCSALDTASVSLQNVNNRFLSLSATQFIESRVYEDDTENSQPDSKHETEALDAINNNDVAELRQSLARLEQYHEPVHILPDSDCDSDSDSDTHTESVVFRPRDLYAQRPLPYTIGTKQWKEKWHAGLMVEDSDSNSEGSAPCAAPLDYSSDDSVQEDETLHYMPSQIWREEEEAPPEPAAAGAVAPASLVPHVEDKHYKSQSQLAAEVARRLAGGIPPAPLSTPPDEMPSPTPAPAPRSNPAPVSSLFRPQPPTRLTGSVFNDEPPPLDHDQEHAYDHDRDSDNDDIFAELENDHLFQKENKAHGQTTDAQPAREPSLPGARAPDALKKPVGAISLFGDSRGAETIGDAILERTRAQPQKQQQSQNKKEPVSCPRIEERISCSDDEVKTGEEDAFADLFSKAASAQSVKPQKYDFKDDLFDDVDDLFSANIVSAVHVKEPDRSAPELFDDDDLFADLDFGSFKNTAPETKDKITEKKIEVKSNSIFDDDSEDDLFSDKHVLEVNTGKKIQKPQTEKTLHSEQNLQSEEYLKSEQILQTEQDQKTEQKAQIEQEVHTVQKNLPNTLFDDDEGDEDLFLTEPKTDFIKKGSITIKSHENRQKDIDQNMIDDKLGKHVPEKLNTSKLLSSPLIFDDDDDDIDDLFNPRTVISKALDSNKQSFEREESVGKTKKNLSDENLLETHNAEKGLLSNRYDIENLSSTQDIERLDSDVKTFMKSDAAPESIVKSNVLNTSKEYSKTRDVVSDKIVVEKDLNTNTIIASDTFNIHNQENVTMESHLKIADQNFQRDEKEENLLYHSKLIDKSKTMDDVSVADAIDKTHLGSPLKSKDDDSDDIFKVNNNVEEKSKNIDNSMESNYTYNDAPTDDDAIFRPNKEIVLNIRRGELLKDTDPLESKGKEENQDRDSTSENHTESDLYNVASNFKPDLHLKPEILQKPNLSTRQNAIPKKIDSEIFSDDELFQKQSNPKTHQTQDLLQNEQKNETKVDDHTHVKNVSDEDDIFSHSPPDQKIDIFHDIYSDQPPDFLKPIEPKKSKNINALFDDDSDDEALFFKRNDNLMDEKLNETPAKDNSLAFGLFSDEPPDLDFDIQGQSKSNVDGKFISKEHVLDDQIFSEHEQPQSPVPTENNVATIGNKDAEIIESPAPLIDTLADKHSALGSVDFLIDANEGVDDSDGVLHSKEPKVVGKLKAVNINIDVKALMPGASPKKNVRPKNTEERADEENGFKEQEEISETQSSGPSLVRSVEFDENADSSLLCNKLSKDRAKIQVKRRPSSRKARREAVRKSGVLFIEDHDTPDGGGDFIGEPTENIEEKNEEKLESVTVKSKTMLGTDVLSINTLGKVYSDVMNDRQKEDTSNGSDEELFGKTARTTIDKHKNAVTEEVLATAETVKDVGRSAASILNDDDDDIFDTFPKRSSSALEPKRDTGKEKKSLFDDLSDDELLFAPSRETGEVKGKDASARPERAPPRLSDDAEELFSAKPNSEAGRRSRAIGSLEKTGAGDAASAGARRVFDDPLSAFQDQ